MLWVHNKEYDKRVYIDNTRKCKGDVSSYEKVNVF